MGKDIDLENEIEKEAAEAEAEAIEEEIEEAEEASAEESAETAEEDSSAEDKLKKELADQKDKYLRLMAEYDNYRKRTAKQQLEARESAVGDTVLKIIKIYDNFERAADTECSDEKYKAGVEMILKQFKDALDKMNVKILDPTGEPFDPATANAVNQIEDPELGENVVAQVFEKGVMIGDKVIRYPMVVVANP
ncbi:MAG: nucleotide exchange factor GrpE [Ruminococcus sp.]|nr:nucleotide exchange factor GrpE [Ruminococcus sp.]